MSEADAEAIRGRSIAVATARLPILKLYTPVRELFLLPVAVAYFIPIPQLQSIALVSVPAVLAAHIDGYLIVRRDGINDPGFEIANTLAGELAEVYQLTVVPGREKDALLLIVATDDWSVRYSFREEGYYTKYRAQLVLRDRRHALARAECRVREAVEVSSYDELLADRSAALKTAFAAVADACAEDLRSALPIPQ